MGPLQSIVHRTAVWCYLFTSDPEWTVATSSEILREVRETLPKPGGDTDNGDSGSSELNVHQLRSWILSVQSSLRKWSKRSAPSNTMTLPSQSADFLIKPKGLDLTPWWKFQRRVRPELLEALVLCQIHKLPEAEVAQALIISHGSLRLRRAQALIRLGEVLQLHRTGKNP